MYSIIITKREYLRMNSTISAGPAPQTLNLCSLLLCTRQIKILTSQLTNPRPFENWEKIPILSGQAPVASTSDLGLFLYSCFYRFLNHFNRPNPTAPEPLTASSFYQYCVLSLCKDGQERKKANSSLIPQRVSGEPTYKNLLSAQLEQNKRKGEDVQKPKKFNKYE